MFKIKNSCLFRVLKSFILKDYEFLSGQCEIFAKELLDQARSSEELSTILYYSDESDAISQDGILGEPCPMRVMHRPKQPGRFFFNFSDVKTCSAFQSKRICRSTKLSTTFIHSMVRSYFFIFTEPLPDDFGFDRPCNRTNLCAEVELVSRYDGVYGWRRMHWGLKVIYSGLIGCSWPILCLFHILFPKTSIGKWAS